MEFHFYNVFFLRKKPNGGQTICIHFSKKFKKGGAAFFSRVGRKKQIVANMSKFCFFTDRLGLIYSKFKPKWRSVCDSSLEIWL